jgi:hypothetical protein
MFAQRMTTSKARDWRMAPAGAAGNQPPASFSDRELRGRIRTVIRVSAGLFIAAVAAALSLLITAAVNRSGSTAVVAIVAMAALAVAARKQWWPS